MFLLSRSILYVIPNVTRIHAYLVNMTIIVFDTYVANRTQQDTKTRRARDSKSLARLVFAFMRFGSMLPKRTNAKTRRARDVCVDGA
jgi:hypothetical protein